MKKIIIILFLPLILTGCFYNKAEKGETSDKLQKVNPKCELEAKELNNICRDENISSLDLKTLNKCSYFISNRDDYLQYCDEEYMWDLIKILELGGAEERKTEDIFYKNLEERCNKRKIGDMLIEEFEFCIKKFSNLNFCEE